MSSCNRFFKGFLHLFSNVFHFLSNAYSMAGRYRKVLWITGQTSFLSASLPQSSFYSSVNLISIFLWDSFVYFHSYLDCEAVDETLLTAAGSFLFLFKANCLSISCPALIIFHHFPLLLILMDLWCVSVNPLFGHFLTFIS